MKDPVIVVGAGPVGLFLALDLGQKGVSCVVLEAQAELAHYPRANTHSARSMEHYRRLGLTKLFRQKGLPADHSNDVAHVTRLSGYELSRVKLPTAAEQQRDPGPYTPEPTFRTSQMYLEPLLLDRLKAIQEVKLLLGHEVLNVGQDESGVWAEVRTVTGESKRFTGSHLVGCDGARSLVRRSIGSSFIGEDGKPRPFFGGRMLSAVFRSRQLNKITEAGRAWQYWVINPDIRALFLALDGEDLFLFHTQRDGDGELEEAALKADIRQAVGADIDIDWDSSAVWLAGRGLVADRYGQDRIFIAGDSAHLFTPTGGFGVNTGIDDAANLAWKIAATVQGWAGPGLLASYDKERQPIGIRNTRAALGFADAVGNCPVPADIEADGASGIAARATVSEYLAEVAHREFLTLGVQLGASYDSDVIVPDGTEPGQDDTQHYFPSARPGGRLPHYWREPGHSLLDDVGPGLTLLCVNTPVPTSGSWTEAATSRGMPFKTLAIADSAGLLGASYVLVRPDQHVAWRGNAPPADIGGLLDRVRGFRQGGVVDNESASSSVKIQFGNEIRQ